MFHAIDPSSDWLAALGQASDVLEPADGFAQLFYESRDDLVVTRATGGAGRTDPTRTEGLSVHSGIGGGWTFLSSPEPADALRLVRPKTGSRPRARPAKEEAGKGRRPTPAMEPGQFEEGLDRLLAEVMRLLPAGGSASARWVSSRQSVAVARPGRPVGVDRRASSWVRLEVRLPADDRDRDGFAVVEKVLRTPSDLEAGPLAIRTVERALSRKGSTAAPRGTMKIVLAPGLGGVVVHELIGHALEADTVLRGGSRLAQSGMRSVPALVVVDDPRRARFGWRMDDEGEPAGAVCLMQDGQVTGHLVDRASAHRMGLPCSGHGRRASFAEPARPRMGCTFLAPGPHPFEEIVRDTPAGVYVRRMDAASTDVTAGLARFRVTDADRIEAGRIAAPLGAFLLEISLDAGLASLDRIGDDLAFDPCIGSCVRDGQALATSVGAPTCRLGVARVVC